MDNYIIPLFWQHGEDEETLTREIKEMWENGVGGFVVESRPHPDFLGSKWWQDMDIIINQAESLGMEVWFFDDRGFPSGSANGMVAKHKPEYVKRFLDEKHIDVYGPTNCSSFYIGAWLKEADRIYSVVAARITDNRDTVDESTLVLLDGHVRNGVLYWDVPGEGKWRVFIIYITLEGGEYWTENYINPIDRDAVKAFIDYCYEPFYEKYKNKFGKTIKGFFTDEPRPGNVCSYDTKIGYHMIDDKYSAGNPYKTVLPYSKELAACLDNRFGGEAKRYAPLLWYNGSGVLHKNVQYVYMDIVSTLFGECFAGQIGDWCRERGVMLIGHFVEDNGAHARLGVGCGHYYRASRGMGAAGLDIVYQILPEVMEGRFYSPFGNLDSEFFYWGIAKMAASEAFFDDKKRGMTYCEIFGAYGWNEGLKLMKWLTDHAAVRGVNRLVPHAFSPKKFPDPDCPPHFYAAGNNPQWKYFKHWSMYANRVCGLLSGGEIFTEIGVLYHANQEWLGDYMPFEKVVKTLHTNQIDCVVVPSDYLASRAYKGIKLIIVPWSEYWPKETSDAVDAFCLVEGTSVIFVSSSDLGANDDYQTPEIPGHGSKPAAHPRQVLPLHELPRAAAACIKRDFVTEKPEKYMRYYHYTRDGGHLFFITNESRSKTINNRITVAGYGPPCLYDAYMDEYYILQHEATNGCITFDFALSEYSSVFLLFGDQFINKAKKRSMDLAMYKKTAPVKAIFMLSLMPYDKQEYGPKKERIGLFDITKEHPDFSGTIKYEFEIEAEEQVDGFLLDIGEAYETAEVFVNGVSLGVCICPPYHFAGGCLKKGKNIITVIIVNTLAKAFGNNTFDRSMVQEPSGLLGPVYLHTK